MNRFIAARIAYFGIIRTQPNFEYDHSFPLWKVMLRSADVEHKRAFDALLRVAYPAAF